MKQELKIEQGHVTILFLVVLEGTFSDVILPNIKTGNNLNAADIKMDASKSLYNIHPTFFNMFGLFSNFSR